LNELDKLQAALRDTTPAPNADAKAEALRLAAENFAHLQESAPDARPISKAPQKGSIWKGITSMFNRANLRPALYATSCLVVAGAIFTNYQPIQDGLPTLQDAEPITSAEVAQAPEPAVLAERAEGDAVANRLPQQAEEEAPQVPSSTSKAANAAPLGALNSQPQAKPAPRKKRAMNQSLDLESSGIVAPLSHQDDAIVAPQPNDDQFASAPENAVKVTAQDPVSTFSIDVDTASYAYVRSTLLNGGQLRPDAVRVEEMVNYFTYDYAAPAKNADTPFTTQISVTQTPWNPDTQLVQIGIQGEKPAVENRPPLNLVFLIDTSGSMQNANKLPLLKQSLSLMLGELHPTDQVAIVTYAGSAGTVLEPTNASETATILAALDALNAGGSTAGGAGLRAAYALADQMRADGEISRVLLATDGDFNVGINNPDDMKSFIEKNRNSGTLAEAQKTLVDQLAGALFPIANDVKIQVEFNPSVVAEYRLIGYETRALNREDFNNDKVDAGEIGAGHQVTALYEITPVGSPAIRNDPLRYAADAAPSDATEIGSFKLRYKSPGATESQLITTPITPFETPIDAGFAAAIAGFGQLLKGSDYTKDYSFDDAITLATQTKGADPFGYRAEAIRLMKLAKLRK